MLQHIGRLERNEFSDWTFGELDELLRECDYAMVGKEGRYRTYRNENDPNLFTFRDGGTGPLAPHCLKQVAKRLRRLGHLTQPGENNDDVHT